jgi:hypothetical protein
LLLAAGLCPAGFDPVDLESNPNRRTVRLEVGHMGGILMGKYAFSFAGSEVYLPANANDNDDAKCNSALKALKSVESITCKRESFNPNTGTGSYLISLLSFPAKPHMNNLIHHNGNPGINLFACNTTKIDAEEAQQPFCFVSDAEPLEGFPRKCLSALTPCRTVLFSRNSGATHMLFYFGAVNRVGMRA